MSSYPGLKHFFCYSEPRQMDDSDASGYLTREHLDEWLPDDRDLDAYFLGPKPFMAQVKKHLNELGVPSAQCHYEFFGPASALEA
ncbi:Flavohemoprotein [compost metagenome]